MNEIGLVFLDNIKLLGITGTPPSLMNTPYVPGIGDLVGFSELTQANGTAAIFRVENRAASTVGGSLTAFQLLLRLEPDQSILHG